MENLELVLYPITVEQLVYIFEQIQLNAADIDGAHFFVDGRMLT